MAKVQESAAVEQVDVNLGDRSYSVVIGDRVLSDIGRWLGGFSSKRAFVFADRRLKTAGAQLKAGLKAAGWQITEYPVSGGESLKSIEALYPIYGKLIRAKAERSSVIFALGGGSVGDAAGFVASTYLRGVSWVGVPTTLLAQVDSSVGGKTAINHELGKNLIGTFHQPSLVVCDISTLKTLSSRDRVAGVGEILKTALAFDPDFFGELETGWRDLLDLKSSAVLRSVKASVKWKAEVVAGDERDLAGRREMLNLGHTFGHALEAHAGYGKFRHGEAVLWGLIFAAELSVARGMLSPVERDRIVSAIREIPLPRLPDKLTSKRVAELMSRDKKVSNGLLKFVLFESIGRLRSVSGITAGEIDKVWSGMRPGRAKR